MIKTHSIIIIFSLSLLLSGCYFALWGGSGTPIETEQLDKIQPGKTTKNEVFEWIGAPIAVLAKNEFNSVPMPLTYGKQDDRSALQSSLQSSIQSNTFFELFSSQHQFHEYHRVYYFHYAFRIDHYAMGLIVSAQTSKVKFDKLWLLVNEKTGIVEDYKFRKGI